MEEGASIGESFQQVPVENKSYLKFWIIGAVIFLIIAGIAFAAWKFWPSSSDQPGISDQEQSEATILDCYNDDFTEIICDPYYALNFTYAFEENLKLCKPSEGTFALGFEPALAIFRGYEILGVQDGYCTINFWFLENKVINPELIGKQMTCKYADSERTVEEVVGLNDSKEHCSGPLMDASVKLSAQSSPKFS